MALQYKCNVQNAAPCIYDSRFDPKVTDLAYGGKVKRRHRHVKRGVILGYVGFESRHQFIAMDKETEKQNEKDRKMLLRLLDDMGVDTTGDEPLHVLGKTYNFYDPRMKHVYRKSGKYTDRVPILKLKKAESDVTDEKDMLKKWLKENNVDFHHSLGVAKLRELKEAKEEELTKPD